MKTLFNTENIKNILIIALLIIGIILSISYCSTKHSSDKKDEKIQENYNVLRVLTDSVKTYKDKNGELVSFKNSFQNDMKTLKENYELMSSNQKALYNELKDNKKVITAMRAELNVKIDSLSNKDHYTISDDSTSITFSDSTKDLKYDITVKGITVSDHPELDINNLELPNNQIITHEWASDGGVKINIKNSNPYFKVNDVDGYVIPEITKETIKPNKFKKFLNSAGKVAIGIGIGALAVFTIIAANQ